MSNKIFVVYGPPRSGKTTHAKAIARHFGLDTVVDDWNGRSRLPRTGVLALTQQRPDADPADRRVLSIEEAMKAAGLVSDRSHA